MILNLNPETQQDYFLFYEQNVRPLLNTVASQPITGYHGIDTHTYNVVFRGVDYALKLRQNPLPVLFACALHDIARTDDTYDKNHAYAALPKAALILKQFSDHLSQEQHSAILRAIQTHTEGRHASDYISACLWDADRTRLSWTRGYRERFFTTPYAKRVASLSNPGVYLRYQALILKRPLEDRENILADRNKNLQDEVLSNLEKMLRLNQGR